MKIDRRRFLVGAGGAALALPWLPSLRGTAYAQAQPPKRLAIVYFSHGLVRTRWAPASTGPLPATGPISDLLAPLGDVREHVLVLSGLGNPARHLYEGDNHDCANNTILTNAQPQSLALAGGESIDQAAARLLVGRGQLPSALLPVTPGRYYTMFFSETGGVVSPSTRFSPNPRLAAEGLFATLPSESTGDGSRPTLRQRLRDGRASMLDAVTENLKSVRSGLSAEDRQRLDAHAEHLHALSQRYTVGAPSGGHCTQPDFGTIPSVEVEPEAAGTRDDETAPAQIDNIVRAFACDVTRVAALQFNETENPSFPWLYDGSVTACRGSYATWHDMVHLGQPTGADADTGVPSLMRGQTFYIAQLAELIRRLATTPDIDGTSTLLDNTLVLALTDFGDESHGSANIPVVLAGLGGRLETGRHLAFEGRTMGDLYATVLGLLGAPSGTTFGRTDRITWDTLHNLELWNDDVRPERFYNGLLPL